MTCLPTTRLASHLDAVVAHVARLAEAKEVVARSRNTRNVSVLRRALRLRALALVVVLAGCASDPTVEAALRSYDDAVAQGLATERLVRPYARINDAAPWGRTRRVEIDR